MRFVSILVAAAALFAGSQAFAANGRVVVVVAGGISVRDLADPSLSNIGSLFADGSAALMNVRSGRPNKLIEPLDAPGMESECITIGAGAMAVGGEEARGAEDTAGADAAAAYAFRTGRAPRSAEVVHTEVARMSRANLAASYRAIPGALGSALRGAGIRTAAIGNSDIPGEPHREAATIAMDQHGLVDLGSVGSPSLQLLDPLAPFGIRDNSRELLSQLDRVLPASRFVVIDFGDTFRADRYAELCTDARVPVVKRQAVRRLDSFIGQVLRRLDFGRDVLFVLSPTPPLFTDLKDESLTPLLARGKGFGPGLLTSPSTRRRGLVTISDVAPSIISALGVDPPAGLVGRPVSTVRAPRAASDLLAMNQAASLQGQRQPVMRGASVAQSVVVAIVTLVLLLGTSRGVRRLVSWCILIPAAMPLVMLYMPLFYSGGLVGAAICLVVLTLVLLAVCRVLFKAPAKTFVWLCAITVASLVVDLVRGAPLISQSIAGYSMVEGARYYGIGNELTGTLVGAALAGLGMLLYGRGPSLRRPGVLAAVVLGIVLVAIGGSALGANAGGAIATAPTVAIALLLRRGWRPTPRNVALVLLASVVVVGLLFAADVLRGGGGQSHIGRAANMAASGHGFGLMATAQRKLALNFMLLSTSVWSRLLGLSLVGSALLYWHRRRSGTKAPNLEISASALACCVGTFLLFALNDSGVLAAATCSVFLWMMLALHWAVDG